MSFILFVAVLVVLIVVHELGHFLVAKFFKVRVDEFGVGYPPRAFVLGTWGGTTYTVNWLPFGGFVRIFGESAEEELSPKEKKEAFVYKPRYAQVLILAAGVLANLLLAWALFSAALYSGAPVGVAESEAAGKQTQLIISSVVPASPADAAGLKSGDIITAITANDDSAALMPSQAAAFIQAHPGQSVTVSVTRAQGDITEDITLQPSHGISEVAPGTPAIGVRMALVASDPIGIFAAIAKGFTATIASFIGVAVGLASFIGAALTGGADWTAVAGPVGIAVLIGDASAVGLVYLLQFTAFISVNLAVINLIPIPALDGGRIVFVLIEGVLRRPLPSSVAIGMNAVGFFALIALMVVVTYHDIARLFA